MKNLLQTALLSLLVLSTLCLIVSQDSGRALSHSSELPSSPWLNLKRPPPAAGAVGVLDGSPSSPNRLLITWANGESSEESDRTLTATPEPWMLPTLGPLRWAAVFDISQGLALVHGSRGWGWTPIETSGGGKVILFDESLKRMVDNLEDEARKPLVLGRYSQHRPNLIVMDQQELRSEPNDRSPGVRNLGNTPFTDCGDNLKRDVSRRSKILVAPKNAATPVRIIERRGDWAKVILPQRNIAWRRCFDSALIIWEKQPSGWARLFSAGPIVGTKLRLWKIDAWGSWP